MEVEPRPLNNGDAQPGVRASAPGRDRRIGGTGATHSAAMTAMAMACRPDLIIFDEAVSALDVSIRAQILDLIADLSRTHNLSYLFISHDLQVVNYFCDRVVVMQQGQLVEIGISDELYQEPKEAYTKMLIEAAPD